ncbi:unnamed protein product, partial [Mesorhabditis belari]|uniref:Sugar phosphate transporter domain-containing protein n=1 Tax=Mesorhabditis belari TaxID=2138241 RepID=A0AAF3EZA5_9BILA
MRSFFCLFKVKIVLLCVLWYSISSASSITNKIILQQYPYPMTVGIFSLMCIPICASPLLRLWEKRKVTLGTHHFIRYLVPISLGRSLAVAAAYFSLYKMPVSYTHTVKATMPLFAVFLGRVVLKERQSLSVYASLLPIIAGVVIASVTELSFSAIGLMAALFSTLTYSFLNILVKKLLRETEMHPVRLLSLNSQLAALFYFPAWFYEDALSMFAALASDSPSIPRPDFTMFYMLFISGILSFGQSVCSYTLIHELTALSYAVCNATKRITVIAISLMTLHNPVTGSNIFGMSLAILGVFCYNRAKQSDKEAAHTLPMTRTHTTLSDASLVALDTMAMNGTTKMQKLWQTKPPPNGSRLALQMGWDEQSLMSDQSAASFSIRERRADDFLFRHKEPRRSEKFA